MAYYNIKPTGGGSTAVGTTAPASTSQHQQENDEEEKDKELVGQPCYSSSFDSNSCSCLLGVLRKKSRTSNKMPLLPLEVDWLLHGQTPQFQDT